MQKRNNKFMSKQKQKYNPKPKEREKPKHLQKPNPININDFQKQLKKLNMELNEVETKALLNYLDSLMLWNTRINLVGMLEWKQTLNELIIDSYHLKEFINFLDIKDNPISWDLGSGAGLPGIPLRIFWHNGNYTLVEVREKRALFMTNFLLKEKNASAKVFWGRAEDYFKQESEKNSLANIIVSRAFMPYQELTKFVFPYLEKDGLLILMLNENLNTFNIEGWRLEKTLPYDINLIDNGLQTRYFHALRKI